MIELYLLIILILIACLLAIESRDLFLSVLMLCAAGFFLCGAFLLMGALEAAASLLIFEILAILILVKSFGLNADQVNNLNSKKQLPGILAAIFFMALFAGYIAFNVKGLPLFGAGTHMARFTPDVRSFDILAASMILFVGILGAFAVLRKNGHAG